MWMSAAMFAFTGNDTIVKLLAEDLPLFQIIFLRGLGVTALLALIVHRRGELDFASVGSRPLRLRVVLEMVGTVTFLLTLVHVPIADIAAIVQLVPLAVTFAAARLLREQVSWSRIGALLVGFVGVLLVIRPGTDSFSPWYLLGLATVGIVVVRELATRSIASDIPSLMVALLTAIAITAMAGVVSIFEGWSSIEASAVALMAGAILFLGVAYVSSVVTIRTGDVSFSALFRYSALVFAIVVQIVVFADVPDGWTFVGAAVIAAAGIWGLTQERPAAAQVASG